MKNLKKLQKPKISFNQDFFAKDCSLSFILSLRPELKDILESLKKEVPCKKYLSIDYQEAVLKPNKRTCRDVSWHTDGIDNNYCIVSWGMAKTLFSLDEIIFKSNDLKERKQELKEKEITNIIEAKEGIPFVYSSNTPHKGRIAKEYGQRIFIRLCYSDTLKPKNVILRGKKERLSA